MGTKRTDNGIRGSELGTPITSTSVELPHATKKEKAQSQIFLFPVAATMKEITIPMLVYLYMQVGTDWRLWMVSDFQGSLWTLLIAQPGGTLWSSYIRAKRTVNQCSRRVS
jgi:hypothetical protein